MALLEVKDLVVNYGLIKAIKGVSFEVNEGEVVALIGANGAGKTTIMHSVNGLIPKSGGKVTLEGKDITVTFDRPTPLQIDGETVLGVTSYTVTV